MHRGSAHNRGLPSFDYDEDTAHTVEVQRELNENGERGSFGFTLLYEKPPIVRTVVPGTYTLQLFYFDLCICLCNLLSVRLHSCKASYCFEMRLVSLLGSVLLHSIAHI